MRISVIGLGYVGAVTAACLARDGHSVTGVDIDPAKVELIRSGRAPIVEEGIQEITAQAIDSGRLEVASGVDERIAECDIVFVCVGTPSASNGSQDLSAIRRVAEEIGRALKAADGFPVVVVRSTVYPGTTERDLKPLLESASGKRADRDFGLCFQPEFLREGSSVKDFYEPPLTIVGGPDASVAPVRELFGDLDCDFVATDIGTAEMMKLVCNAFHAMKIGFANEIGRLGKSLGVDARDVMRLVCMDTKLNISPAYLRPGFAFGGSCLPKDLRALVYMGRRNDIELDLLGGILPSNEAHIDRVAQMIMQRGSRRVGMIGLSFKPGTDDLRESPLVALAERLIGKGYELLVYDPGVSIARLIGANRRYIRDTIPHIETLLRSGIDDVLAHAETIVVGYHDADVRAALTRGVRADQTVIDLAGLPSDERPAADYEGICW